MQRKLIVFCAAVVLVCSIDVYVSVGKQKISRKAEQWIDESMAVLTASSAWFEIGYELQIQRKHQQIDIFIEKAERIIELARMQDAVFWEINGCRNIPFCDFSDIVKNHKILTYDICSEPKYDYENTPLAEYIEEAYVAENEEMSQKVGRTLSLTIDYHQFDFNDDGLKDYLLCVDGSLFSGSAGNAVEIYIQEADGTVRKVLDIHLRLINPYSPTGHEEFTVLDEKTDGYYALVLPESNRILRYDKEKDWYEFQDRDAILLEEQEKNENSNMVYDKYFRLEQGELARIEGVEDLSACGMFGFLNSHFGGVTFDIDEDILVQYRNDSMSPVLEHELPRAIIITGPDADMGFMDARAGMNFVQIQENAYETDIQEGFMYFDDGIVYYIQYMDEHYDYIFISDYEDGRDSWLVVEKRISE
ncbi:MAG: hypothetical protein K2J99_01265 [Lachnospiraceae bacterium]|nr:hypothetical protein [Lachnospiraceae bacterium]